jgi:hypothetical protein
MTTNTEQVLKDRGSRYGKFAGHAYITMRLKDVIDAAVLNRDEGTFSPSQVEAMHMIAHKLGRVLNGDPDYDDNWIDIAGYSTLIVNQLHGEDV